MNSSPMICPPTSGMYARVHAAEPNVVVRGDRISARPEPFDHILNSRDHLLLAYRPGAEGIGIGDAAFLVR